MTADAALPGARLLSADAHALRNHVATIRSVVRLVDDEEIAQALDDASRAIQVALERAIVLSRVELGARPDDVELELAALLGLAARRARREGATVEDGPHAPDGLPVRVPGPWAERLVADLLHHAVAPGATAGSADGQLVELRVQLASAGIGEVLASSLEALAGACGGELRIEGDEALLRLPLSAG